VVPLAPLAPQTGLNIPETLQPARLRKSITWLECERAREKGKSVLAFLVDPKYNWPETAKEGYRLAKAAYEGKLTPELSTDVKEAIKQLEQFKNWLNKIGVRASFSLPPDLATNRR